MSTEMPTPRRRYEKKARATKEQETRRRIVEAALELHGTVGPMIVGAAVVGTLVSLDLKWVVTAVRRN